jgi:hypothetical protein
MDPINSQTISDRHQAANAINVNPKAFVPKGPSTSSGMAGGHIQLYKIGKRAIDVATSNMTAPDYSSKYYLHRCSRTYYALDPAPLDITPFFNLSVTDVRR